MSNLVLRVFPLLVLLFVSAACGSSDANGNKASNATATDAAASTFPQGQEGFGPTTLLSIAAKTLKLTDSELQVEIQKGKSISAIGREHGVNRDALKQAILDQLKASTQQAGQAANLNSLIDSFLDQSGGPLSPPTGLTPGPGGAPGAPPAGAPLFNGTPPAGFPPISGTPPAGFPPPGGTPPPGFPPVATPQPSTRP